MLCLAENQTHLFIKDFDYQIIKLSSVGDNIVPDIIEDYDHVNNLTLKLKAYKEYHYWTAESNTVSGEGLRFYAVSDTYSPVTLGFLCLLFMFLLFIWLAGLLEG